MSLIKFLTNKKAKAKAEAKERAEMEKINKCVDECLNNPEVMPSKVITEQDCLEMNPEGEYFSNEKGVFVGTVIK